MDIKSFSKEMIYILAVYIKEQNTASECCKLMTQYMKENSVLTSKAAKDIKNFTTDRSTSAISKTTGHTDRAHYDIMMSIILEIFKMDAWKVTGSGGTERETSILVNGKIIKPMDTAFTSLSQAITKVKKHKFRIFFKVCQARRRTIIIQEWRYLQRFILKWHPKWLWIVLLERWFNIQRRFFFRTSLRQRCMDQFQRRPL